ncbi:MAG: TetR family transcriptional regulator C-terminal domain-containing protein, partial [Hyphomicrobium sp.]
LGYIDFRKAILAGTVPEFTCLAGTMLQETYASSPAIREACARAIFTHAEELEADIAAAIAAHKLDASWSAKSLALYTQAVLQGAFILAKAEGGSSVAGECIDHLRRYVVMLFQHQEH